MYSLMATSLQRCLVASLVTRLYTTGHSVSSVPCYYSAAHLSGTKKPNSACDVMFYGASSSPKGVIRQPGASLLWNMEGPLSCSFLMVPAVNQSLSLKVREHHCQNNITAENVDL